MSASDQELELEREDDHENDRDRGPDTDPDPDADSGSDSDHDGPDDGDATAPDAVSDLPPSAKLVYKVLEYEGAMTQEEIATESRLCARTVRYALGKLEDGELVASRVCLEDARQSKYRIAD